MEYRNMGRTGLKVSDLCLGTMTFGHGADLETSKKMVQMSLDAGINFFDTANAYGGGLSEEYLGQALKGRRRQAVVATKFFNPMGPGINDSGMSRVNIFNAVEDSLRRLQMDYVDILYIHHVDVQTRLEEMLRAMEELVRQGKTRYIACSNYEAWRLSEAMAISERNNWARFECYQPLYNLVTRDIEDELIPLCQYKGVGVVTWAPLAGGYLSGKYKPGEITLAGTRSEERWAYPSEFFAANSNEILQTLLDVSKELGRSPAQVAVRWVVEQPGITSAIIGARTLAQLEDNLQASTWTLPPEMKQRLDAVSRPRERYPKAMEATMKARRDNAVNMPSL
ncbi:MAG: aldo/keto reductase [Chloroflexi bacterium]|nr:MAG: aldo/keto reductase [Chloroflexota bacterium]